MSVGQSAPRYEKLALLYPKSLELRSHLAEYFIVVVKLCQTTLAYSQKSAFGQLKSALSD